MTELIAVLLVILIAVCGFILGEVRTLRRERFGTVHKCHWCRWPYAITPWDNDYPESKDSCSRLRCRKAHRTWHGVGHGDA
jgi:hypothetical protein